MNALIIEDEKPAREVLLRALKRTCPDVQVIAAVGSVRESVSWLETPGHEVDLIFMDVELEDGSSFEIFRQTKVTAKVIMTTAFDKYALKAFEAGSVDYLLKPYEDQALVRAVSRCRASSQEMNLASIRMAMRILAKSQSNQYRKRVIVRLGRQIIPVTISEIAYFFAEGKTHYIVMDSGSRYIFDEPIEELMAELDEDLFFRISRNYYISFHSIRGIVLRFVRTFGRRARAIINHMDLVAVVSFVLRPVREPKVLSRLLPKRKALNRADLPIAAFQLPRISIGFDRSAKCLSGPERRIFEVVTVQIRFFSAFRTFCDRSQAVPCDTAVDFTVEFVERLIWSIRRFVMMCRAGRFPVGDKRFRVTFPDQLVFRMLDRDKQ